MLDFVFSDSIHFKFSETDNLLSLNSIFSALSISFHINKLHLLSFGETNLNFKNDDYV